MNTPIRKDTQLSVERLLLWLPPALSLLPVLLLAAFSLPSVWFTNQAGVVSHKILMNLSLLNFVAGAALLWRPLRERVCARLDAVGALTPRLHVAWLGTIYAGIWGFFFFLKYCQYRGFQLPGDTAATVNMAYNFLHELSFENSIFGTNNFAIHFQPIIALYAPFLLIGNGTLVLLAVQCAVLASAPIAVYGLIFNRTRSTSAGLAGLWLCLSSPFMSDIAINNLETHVNLAAFFLWAMFFVERRRFLPAATLFLLAAASNEQTTFAFFGLGLYLIFRGPSQPKARAWGAAVCAGAACLFILEMMLINSFPRAARLRDWSIMYGHLGATPAAAVVSAVTDPLRILKTIAWPLGKLWPLGRILWTTGFFCLLSPPALLAWFVNYLPFFLAAPGSPMSQLTLHYAGQTAGPIWWAMAGGLSLAFLWLAPRKQTSLLLVWALFVGGMSIRRSPRLLVMNWLPQYFEEGPKVVAAIPPDAAVWSSQFLTPWLGARSRIKMLGDSDDAELERHRFLPDYLAIDKSWFQTAEADFRKRIAALVAQETYEPVLNTTNFIVFKHPHYPPPARQRRLSNYPNRRRASISRCIYIRRTKLTNRQS